MYSKILQVHKFLIERGSISAAHEFEMSEKFFFDMEYVYELIWRGSWDPLQRYLEAFFRSSGGKVESHIFFQLYRHMLWESLVNGNREEAAKILQNQMIPFNLSEETILYFEELIYRTPRDKIREKWQGIQTQRKSLWEFFDPQLRQLLGDITEPPHLKREDGDWNDEEYESSNEESQDQSPPTNLNGETLRSNRILNQGRRDSKLMTASNFEFLKLVHQLCPTAELARTVGCIWDEPEIRERWLRERGGQPSFAKLLGRSSCVGRVEVLGIKGNRKVHKYYCLDPSLGIAAPTHSDQSALNTHATNIPCYHCRKRQIPCDLQRPCSGCKSTNQECSEPMFQQINTSLWENDHFRWILIQLCPTIESAKTINELWENKEIQLMWLGVQYRKVLYPKKTFTTFIRNSVEWLFVVKDYSCSYYCSPKLLERVETPQKRKREGE
eukprot:TRINITY_DN5556_c0_g1_i1.p1 TRINITY_DN5556_c0_g1~~TRINITY_DN5556_c0_g1_i1.p1  ORF type:complete len:468 (-),score=77.29 TRINITY_DN5556_c0_g1_i1:25-1347(-)